MAWRWTDEKYNVLPKNCLNKISPLSEDSSKLYFQKANTLLSQFELQLESNRISSADNPDLQNYLTEKIQDKDIIINWSETETILTTKEIFIQYWEDFCYPSSDDVSIWSETEQWLLQFYHDEEFGFAHENVA